jgi:hypothetical protein
MRITVKVPWIAAILMLAAICTTGAAADDHGAATHAQVTVVFKDGHRQSLDLGDIARIDFKAPAGIVFKDGRKSIPGADISNVEFETASVSAPSHNHFVGKWEVGLGNGSTFYITLEPSGEAMKSHGSPHGTWVVVNGEARISWDDGWHDAIRKVGAKHEKFAYEPGKTFDDPPSNVTAARNKEVKPI